MRMILPSDCNACKGTLRVDCKLAVSLSQPAVILSQPLCTYQNKKITYVVHSWYMGAHSTLLLVLLCHSDHWLLFSQPHEDALTPSPPENKAKLHKELKCTGIQHQPGKAILFPTRIYAKSLDDGLFDGHRWRICTPPVSAKHFPLNRFYASLIITY